MTKYIKVKVNGKEIGTVATNRSLTIREAMYSLGYDITNPADLQKGYENCVEGFYVDDNGEYQFDFEAVELC